MTTYPQTVDGFSKSLISPKAYRLFSTYTSDTLYSEDYYVGGYLVFTVGGSSTGGFGQGGTSTGEET